MCGQPDSTHLPRLGIRAADTRVELAAVATLRRCQQSRGLSALPLPIPVDEWIESPLGYRFEIVDENELGPGILGRARPTLGEIAVSELLMEHQGRYRFTCAHELGHMVLHRAMANAYSDASLPYDGDAPEIEREADRFAAAFLMPGDALGDAITQALSAEQLAPKCLELLRGDDARAVWLWRRCFIPRLAEVFGVSKPAMVYRCREVRLHDRKRLIRPKLIPLVLAPESAVASLGLERLRVVGGVPISPG